MVVSLKVVKFCFTCTIPEVLWIVNKIILSIIMACLTSFKPCICQYTYTTMDGMRVLTNTQDTNQVVLLDHIKARLVVL